MKVWEDGGSYLELLKADEDVRTYLDSAALEALFDLDQHFRHVNTVFERVFALTDRHRGLRSHDRTANAI